MVKIKELSDNIKDEIDDAGKYIDLALRCKEGDKTLADTYCKLAEEELGHMDILHKQVVRIIDQYKATNGPTPPAMQAKYDVLHELYVNEANQVKIKIRLYKEG